LREQKNWVKDQILSGLTSLTMSITGMHIIKRIVTIICDTGLKYLDGDLYR
jgi:cysteine synthase